MPCARILDIAFVRFTAPDLEEMGRFLEEFGLGVFAADGMLYGRARDGSPFVHATAEGPPAFTALGLRAESLSDLERIAAGDGAAVAPFDGPGGGWRVILEDPDGTRVEVVAGQAFGETELGVPEAAQNTPRARRRLRTTVRVAPGPSHVARLGHCVLNVSDFRRSEAWYKERFGFLTSDEIHAAPGFAIGAFLRCDRGDHPTDHHTLFLLQAPSGPGFNHAAFEVFGVDDLMVGHAHLKARGRRAAWGVGRHKLGSQVFDYWRDPWGFELEHWTDGDLFTVADGAQTADLGDLLGVQWGPAYPGPGAAAEGDTA